MMQENMITSHQGSLHFLNIPKSSVVFPQLGKLVFGACTSISLVPHV